MESYSTLATVFTVVSFFVFAAIVWWAWSARRKPEFDAAALAPFALADEAGPSDRQSRAQATQSAAGNEGARS